MCFVYLLDSYEYKATVSPDKLIASCMITAIYEVYILSSITSAAWSNILFVHVDFKYYQPL